MVNDARGSANGVRRTEVPMLAKLSRGLVIRLSGIKKRPPAGGRLYRKPFSSLSVLDCLSDSVLLAALLAEAPEANKASGNNGNAPGIGVCDNGVTEKASVSDDWSSAATEVKSSFDTAALGNPGINKTVPWLAGVTTDS